MDGGGSGGYPPLRGGSTSNGVLGRASTFNNDPPGPGGGGAPLPYANGMLSRAPGPGGMSTLQREDSLQSLGGGRAQQPSHEVFMVREAGGIGGGGGGAPLANRGSSSDRSSFPPPVRSSYPEQESEQRQSISHSSSHHGSSSHHRVEQRERERDRDKDKEASLSSSSKSLQLPKMLKIAVVGDSTAGKTAICNAFTSDGYSFSRNYHMTTGVSIYAKSIKLPTARGEGGGGGGSSSTESSSSRSTLMADEPRINLVLVDSAGKDIYRELLPQYWDRLDGVALVIDLTSSTALDTASDWVNLTKGCILSGQKNPAAAPVVEDGSGDQTRKREHNSSILGVLIGSKNDLKDQRTISPKAAHDFATQHGLQYFECSAKENSGMEEPFFFLAHQWASSSPASGDKENFQEGAATAGGGIFGRSSGTGGGGTSTSSSSRRSAFQSRQSSSSEQQF